MASGIIEDSLTLLTASNIFVGLLLGVGISYLLGLLRLLQLVLIMPMISIVYSAPLTYFYKLLVHLLELDMMSFIPIYDASNYLDIEESQPFLPYFEQYGFRDTTFAYNSGPFIGMTWTVVVNYIGWKLINTLCKKFYRFKICRKIGIYSENHLQLKDPFIAIIVEAYIDLAFASFMQVFMMTF